MKGKICEQLSCSEEIKLSNSRIDCLSHEEGIYTAVLSGHNAVQLVAMALQQRTFDLEWENGSMLTLKVCESESCSTTGTHVQGSNTARVVGGVIAVIIIIVAMVIGVVILTDILLRFKHR